MKPLNFKKSITVAISFFFSILPANAKTLDLRLRQQQKAVVTAASEILDTFAVSYIYGGARLGSAADCDECSKCLLAKNLTQAKQNKLSACPVCGRCSLDCSHFTQLVFDRAGFAYPYLSTDLMRTLSKEKLFKSYHLIDLGINAANAAVGDFLVYDGHVVIVEQVLGVDQGTIIHATGGRDIREPGQGVQRERFITFSKFRGPLRRILRHQGLQ